jgi:sigma-E factor negative regulatory protein RseA
VSAERRWHLDRPDLASKLDLFLVNHQEAAPAAGVKGMLPYATLVGYEGPR